MNPIIGIDFDNTIVCYDAIFQREAFNRNLIPPNFPANKEKIRNYLREQHQEKTWTELQGYVYGICMQDAHPFPGILEFLQTALKQKIKIFIISHKTQYPFSGPKYDLYQAAKHWLGGNIFSAELNLSLAEVFFLETKKQKCQKISELNCTHFIDDLPELFSESFFPPKVTKILFSPQNENDLNSPSYLIKKSWDQIHQYFFGKL